MIEYPPEPNDIIWENLHISTKEKNIRRFIAYCVISIVLAFTSWVIFNISKLQHEAQNESLIVKKLAQLASVIIIFLNFILSYAIKKISEYESPPILGWRATRPTQATTFQWPPYLGWPSL